MLSMTTKRHKMFVCIPGYSGDSSSEFGGVGEVVDSAVDRLLELCQADAKLHGDLDQAADSMAAKVLISRHLKEATPEAPWMRSGAMASSLCSRVLYLMRPTSFHFAKYGWIH